MARFKWKKVKPFSRSDRDIEKSISLEALSGTWCILKHFWDVGSSFETISATIIAQVDTV